MKKMRFQPINSIEFHSYLRFKWNMLYLIDAAFFMTANVRHIRIEFLKHFHIITQHTHFEKAKDPLLRLGNPSHSYRG